MENEILKLFLLKSEIMRKYVCLQWKSNSYLNICFLLVLKNGHTQKKQKILFVQNIPELLKE